MDDFRAKHTTPAEHRRFLKEDSGAQVSTRHFHQIVLFLYCIAYFQKLRETERKQAEAADLTAAARNIISYHNNQNNQNN